MNVELIRQIADVIEKNPECHNQGHFSSEGNIPPSRSSYVKPNQIHTCGTTACIAGWAVHLTPVDKRPIAESISECAKKLLELGEVEGSILFSGDWQPRSGRTVPEELRRIADQQSVRETVTGGNRSTVTGGYASTVTGGYASTVTGGDASTVTGGYDSTVTGGNRSTVTGGDDSTVTGGDDSTVTGGNRSTVTGGDDSTVTGGDASTVTGGDASTVTGGNRSTVTGGNRSTVTGGDASTVTGGDASTVTGGDASILVIYRIKNGNRVPTVGMMGETLDAAGNPLKPKTKYELNDEGKFVEKTEAES